MTKRVSVNIVLPLPQVWLNLVINFRGDELVTHICETYLSVVESDFVKASPISYALRLKVN